MINAATILRKIDDSIYYSKKLKSIKAAYLQEYVTPNGQLVSGT